MRLAHMVIDAIFCPLQHRTKGFKHKGLEKFFLDGIKKGIQAKHASKLELILDTLNAAQKIRDMDFPGSDLHISRTKIC